MVSAATVKPEIFKQPDGSYTDLDGNKILTIEEIFKLPYDQASIEWKRARGGLRGFIQKYRKYHHNDIQVKAPQNIENLVIEPEIAFSLVSTPDGWVVKEYVLEGVYITKVEITKPEFKEFAVQRMQNMLLNMVSKNNG